MTDALAFHPLTPDRWPDLENLFGPNGACAGCWCMYYRQTRRDWKAGTGPERKSAFKDVCKKGTRPPGVIAYRGDAPVGWVAVAPRADYVRLGQSKILVPLDDKPVWSITCFFIHRTARRQGLMEKLIGAAVDFARQEGATIVEAYPKPVAGKESSGDLFIGALSTFERAGFKVMAKPSEKRTVVRKTLRTRRAKRAQGSVGSSAGSPAVLRARRGPHGTGG
jgi:GNAT superfamily N-acetyltransferase